MDTPTEEELDLMMDHTRFDEVDEDTARLARKTVETLREAHESSTSREPCKCDEEDIAPEEMPGFTEWLSRVAKEASQKAAQETLDAGRPITIVEGDYIVRKYPDGHSEIIKEAPKPVKVEKRVYHI